MVRVPSSCRVRDLAQTDSATLDGMSAIVGRFAPTPSGPLHFGSLLTALGSWLSARAAGGRWLLRIDDLDRPRVRPQAEATLLRQLEAHGLVWDGAVRRQSEHLPEYAHALQRLRATGWVYACTCTRAQLQQHAAEGEDAVYPGTCRDARHAESDAALRLRVGAEPLRIEDPVHGDLRCQLDRDIGDFVVRRRDGQFAYQLACAVDEAAQGITEAVRGADLIGSSFRQLHLMRVLGLTPPKYRHLPLVVAADGRKLSKQNEALPIDSAHAARNLRLALQLLGQPAPDEALREPTSILESARTRWTPTGVPAGPLMSP